MLTALPTVTVAWRGRKKFPIADCRFDLYIPRAIARRVAGAAGLRGEVSAHHLQCRKIINQRRLL